MLHVNRLDGMTIAVSENKYITQIARRTIMSNNALSVIVPVLEEIVGWNSARVRTLFETNGFMLREWDKVRTDSITGGSVMLGCHWLDSLENTHPTSIDFLKN